MIGESVVRIRAGAPTGQLDRYRNPILGPDVETVIRGVAFAPASSAEQAEPGRTRVNTAGTLYARGSVDLTAADRVRVRGAVYDVDGDPQEWRSPFTGAVVGVTVGLKRTGG